MGLTAYRAAAKARIDAELKLRAEQWFATLPPPHADALRTIAAEIRTGEQISALIRDPHPLDTLQHASRSAPGDC